MSKFVLALKELKVYMISILIVYEKVAMSQSQLNRQQFCLPRVGRMGKFLPLPELIRLQDLLNSACSCKKKIKNKESYFPHSNVVGLLILSDKGSYRTNLFCPVAWKSLTVWQYNQLVSQHLLRPPRGSCCSSSQLRHS